MSIDLKALFNNDLTFKKIWAAYTYMLHVLW